MGGSYLILVAGVPGTGKTTVGRNLAITLNCTMLESSDLFISMGAAKRDPTGRLTTVIDESLASRVLAHLRSLLKHRCIILPTIYPSLFLDDELLSTNVPFIVLLRTHPLELYTRLSARKWPEPKVIENCVAEAFNTVAEELKGYEDFVVEVDTTGASASDSTEAVLAKLAGWEVGIRIDWMSDDKVVEAVSRWLSRIDFHYHGVH